MYRLGITFWAIVFVIVERLSITKEEVDEMSDYLEDNCKALSVDEIFNHFVKKDQ